MAFGRKKEKDVDIRNVNKKMKQKGKGASLAFAFLSLALTVGAFAGLLFVQDIFSEDIVYKNVVVAAKEIPENFIVKTENANEYFQLKNVNVIDCTDDAMTSLDEIVGQRSKVKLVQGEIIMAKDFDNISEGVTDVENPIQVSVPLSSVGGSVGGYIREGDVVNITMMFSKFQLGLNGNLATTYSSNSLSSVPTSDFGFDDSIYEDVEEEEEEEEEEDFFGEDEFDEFDELDEENEDDTGADISREPVEEEQQSSVPENVSSEKSGHTYENYADYILENVYVEKALDASGLEISSSDKSTPASILIFTIDKSEELTLANAIANATDIRVSKVVKKAEGTASETKPEDAAPDVAPTENAESNETPAVKPEDAVEEQ